MLQVLVTPVQPSLKNLQSNLISVLSFGKQDNARVHFRHVLGRPGGSGCLRLGGGRFRRRQRCVTQSEAHVEMAMCERAAFSRHVCHTFGKWSLVGARAETAHML